IRRPTARRLARLEHDFGRCQLTRSSYRGGMITLHIIRAMTTDRRVLVPIHLQISDALDVMVDVAVNEGVVVSALLAVAFAAYSLFAGTADALVEPLADFDVHAPLRVDEDLL